MLKNNVCSITYAKLFFVNSHSIETYEEYCIKLSSFRYFYKLCKVCKIVDFKYFSYFCHFDQFYKNVILR